MNFKGITLAVLSFVLVAVSCSVENDAYMNDVNKEMASVSEEYASLSFNIGMGGQTKSVSGPTTESASPLESQINNCIIVLTEGNAASSKIVALQNATNDVIVPVEGDKLAVNANMLIKAKDNLYAIAIANADYSTFSSCNTLGDLESRTLTLSQDNLVKVSQPVAVGAIPAEYKSTSTKGTDVYTIPQVLTLTQLTAKVELVAFNVSYTGDNDESLEAPVVVLQKIALANAKSESHIFSQAGNSFSTDLVKEGAIDYTTAGTLFSCYTFQNNDPNNKTALELTVKIGTKDAKVKSYTIKTPENGETLEVVKPGYIYRVTVNLSVNKISKEFDVALQYEAVPFQAVTVNIPDFD